MRLDAPFAKERCAALFAEILAHDTVHSGCTLPAVVHLGQSAEQLERCFRISHQLWLDGLDVPAARRIASAVLRAGRLEEIDALRLKHLRARFKQLRFLFALLDARHRYPPLLDRFTILMGQMQDALRLGRHRAARARAIQLLLRLRATSVARLVAECAAYEPTTAASFRAYLVGGMERLDALGGGAAMTTRQFHAARKVVSRLVAFCDTLKVLYPSEDIFRTSRYLGTLNGLMGGLHDDLVARRRLPLHGLEREPVLPPPEIVQMARAVTQAFDAGMVSAGKHPISGFETRPGWRIDRT